MAEDERKIYQAGNKGIELTSNSDRVRTYLSFPPLMRQVRHSGHGSHATNPQDQGRILSYRVNASYSWPFMANSLERSLRGQASPPEHLLLRKPVAEILSNMRLSSDAPERMCIAFSFCASLIHGANILSHSELPYRSKVGMPNGYLSWG